MSSDSYVSLSGALTALQQLEIVANNLANADTLGFKRDRVAFVSVLEAAVRDAEEQVTPGAAGYVFPEAGSSGPDLAAGTVAQTGAPLDVAIEGPGFFALQTPDGTRYTRAGSFQIDAQQRLVTPDGLPVLGDGGPIQVTDRTVAIGASGEVVDARGDVLGRLRVVAFDAPDALRKEGGNRFAAVEGAAPRSLEAPHLLERSVERSNVQPVQELAAMVVLQRAFDIAMRVLQSDDEATQRLIQEVSS